MDINKLIKEKDIKHIILSLDSTDDDIATKAREALTVLQKKNWDACKKAVNEMQKDPQGSDKALLTFADMLFELGKRLSYIGTEEDVDTRKKEVEAYNKTLTVNPAHISCLNNKGITLMQLNEWDEAADCFGQILKIDPNYHEAGRNRAISFWNGKNFEEAIRAAEEAVQHDSSLQSLLDYMRKNAPYRVVHLG